MLDDDGVAITPLRRWSTLALHFFARASAAINCIVYPFQLAFLGPGMCLGDGPAGWATLYILLDVPLWLDALHTAWEELSALKERLALHHDSHHRTVMWHVQETASDLLALLCVFPWDFMTGGGRCLGYGQLSRCFFVGRMLASSHHVINQAFPALGSQRAAAFMLELLLSSLLFLHWYACLTYHVASTMGSFVDIDGSEVVSWVESQRLDARPIWSRYVRSFDRGLLIVMGEGVHGQQDYEILVALCGLLVGTAMVAFFTSRLVEIITSTNHFEQMVRQKIGRVSTFMRSANLPHELQMRCLAHLQHFMLSTSLTTDTSELLRELSVPLRSEIALASRSKLVLKMLRGSGWFDEPGLEAAGSGGGGKASAGDSGGIGSVTERQMPFVKALVQKLQPAVFSPGDTLITEAEASTECYFIAHGVVEVPLPDGSVAMRSEGECIGEIAMLTNSKRSASCTATSFVEAYVLSQPDFEAVVHHFPDIEARVKAIADKRLADQQEAAARGVLEKAASPPERKATSAWSSLGLRRQNSSLGLRRQGTSGSIRRHSRRSPTGQPQPESADAAWGGLLRMLSRRSRSPEHGAAATRRSPSPTSPRNVAAIAQVEIRRSPPGLSSAPASRHAVGFAPDAAPAAARSPAKSLPSKLPPPDDHAYNA